MLSFGRARAPPPSVAATAETQTDVNWEKFLEICDKVSEEGETGYVFSLETERFSLLELTSSLR